MRSSCRVCLMLALACFLPASGRGIVASNQAEPQEVSREKTSREKTEKTTVSGQILDGLERPVSGVRVKFDGDHGAKPEKPAIVVSTGEDGRFQLKVDENVKEVELKFDKDGYVATSRTLKADHPDKISIYRMRDWDEAGSLFRLEGDKLDRALREFLVSEDGWSTSEHDDKIYRFLFIHQAAFRPALRRLIADPHIGDQARDFLDLFGDPGDEDLFPRKRKFASKHDVREIDLVDAIRATARHLNFFSSNPEPKIDVDTITLAPKMDRAMVRCGINMVAMSGIMWRFVFHKQGNRWVLRSMKEVGRA